MPYTRALHWFRRDLRITDNTALLQASAESAEVVPLFILSNWKKTHAWTGPGRQAFLCGCLESLSRNIEALGGELLIRQGEATSVIEKLLNEAEIDAVFFNRDPDPYGLAIEEKVVALCRKRGIAVHDPKDHVLHERAEILTGSGGPYRVYTPYSRSWFDAPKPTSINRKKPGNLVAPGTLKSLPLPTLKTWGLEKAPLPQLPPTGERAARERLKKALAGPIPTYAQNRNLPAGQTTSRLGPDLRYGTLSIREIYLRVMAASQKATTPEATRSYRTFLQELAWREFYMQILWHFPEVLDTEFNADYRSLPWENNPEGMAAWSEGRTGFPIVDAGIRELTATGFMHNRVRMIVAMFLTKDLRISWRQGESFFLQHLLDGEIASNNGGWQWSAGTGADAAPYFRIQNPWTQTKSYDPEGAYIKTWIPELKNANPKALFTAPDKGRSVFPGYPSPIVDHKTERENTLAWFKAHRGQ
ncbi:MAG: deoxyribodipyrimidine photo-lyase [Verrucomicrobiota bacterium]